MDSSIDEGVEVEEALSKILTRDREKLGLEEGAKFSLDGGRGGEEFSCSRKVAMKESESPSSLIEDKSLLEDGDGSLPEGLLLHEVVNVFEVEALLLLLEVLLPEEVENRLFAT